MAERTRGALEKRPPVSTTRSPLFSARNAAAASFLLLGAAVASKYMFKKDLVENISIQPLSNQTITSESPSQAPLNETKSEELPSEEPSNETNPEPLNLEFFPSGGGAIDVYAKVDPASTSVESFTLFTSRREKNFIAVFAKEIELGEYDENASRKEFNENVEKAIQSIKVFLAAAPVNMAELDSFIWTLWRNVFKNGISVFVPYLDRKKVERFYYQELRISLFNSWGERFHTLYHANHLISTIKGRRVIFSLNGGVLTNLSPIWELTPNTSIEDFAKAFAKVEMAQKNARIEKIAFSVQPIDGIEFIDQTT